MAPRKLGSSANKPKNSNETVWHTTENNAHLIINKLDSDFIEIHLAVPYYGTPLYELAKKEGLIDDTVLGKDYFNSPTTGTKFLCMSEIEDYKRKIKEDRLFVTLREREHYRKPSDIKREKKAKARLRNKYKVEKENNSYGLWRFGAKLYTYICNVIKNTLSAVFRQSYITYYIVTQIIVPNNYIKSKIKTW